MRRPSDGVGFAICAGQTGLQERCMLAFAVDAFGLRVFTADIVVVGRHAPLAPGVVAGLVILCAESAAVRALDRGFRFAAAFDGCSARGEYRDRLELED